MSRFAAERQQDLDEVLRWYELQLDLLNEEDRRLPQILAGPSMPDRYHGLTLSKLREQFAVHRKHLQYAAMLHLLTTTEALLQMDFESVAKGRRKSLRRPC